MAAIKKLLANLFIKSFDFDPDSADVTDVGWVACRDFSQFAFGFFRTIGTGAVDTMRVIGNTLANGSGTDVVIKTKTISSQPDALSDQIYIEVSADEIAAAAAAAGVTILGISLALEFATSTDEGVATYVFGGPRFAKDGLTADIVA